MKQFILALGILAAPAFPSTTAETTMAVPFDFKAGRAALPAGEYRVRTELSSGGVYRLFFQNSKGNTMVVPMLRIDNAVPGSTKSGFIFRCDTPGACQLTEVHSGSGPAFLLHR
ncbi:MAG: hypothetical protein JNK48_03295 [Bryobacterales bacterium]|nr:hypothetical protein [Bryobacterales bacterium]